jgi:LacI family transcriptional regulator
MINKIRIKDIADKAGVSIGTVDRVLHNRGEVSIKTKQKILSIIEEYDYHPNIMAQALTSKKKYVFATLIPKADSENSYWEQPLKGILEAEKKLKVYNVKIKKFFFNQNSKDEFSIQFENLIKIKPQAVLLAPVFEKEAQNYTKILFENDIPFVFINSDIKNNDRLCFVGQDDFQSGMLAGKLASINLTEKDSVLIVNITRNYKNKMHYVNRNKGFLHYFKDKPIKTMQLELNDNLIENFSTIIKENPTIQSVFVSNSKVYKVAGVLEKINLKHILLIGYDLIDENIRYLKAEYIDFLISQNSIDQGHKGIRYLFDSIVKKETVKKEYLMPITIITKENLPYYKLGSV